jgi:hypothetical protein
VVSTTHGTTSAVEPPTYHDQLLPSVPTQMYMIPLPKTALFEDVLKPSLNVTVLANGNLVTSLVSITISTDNTVIWYDRWEDAFESHVMKDGSVRSSHAEIRGDGDASNGCRPDIPGICTDVVDVFMAGDSMVIESRLKVPRTATNWFSTSGMRPDAGHRIYANVPLAVSRSAYSGSPVGAIEVFAESKWGIDFELPIDSGIEEDDTKAHFAIVQEFVMYNTDGNEIDGVKAVLIQGQGLNFAVQRNCKRIHADYPVQVHLLTSGSAAARTMRWYSLIPDDRWSNSYMVPYGDVRECEC